MEKTLFEKTVTFLSNHFELLIYISASLAILFILIFVSVKFSDVKIRKIFHTTVRGVLYTIIIAGQIVLFAILGHLYWKNYQKPAPELELTENIMATTQWVKDNLRVYFIDGDILRSVKINGQGKEDVFQANEPIKEYYFSPDGTYLLILTLNDLTLINRLTKEDQHIDSLHKPGAVKSEGKGESPNGSISGVQWAPDSQRFIYEVARWSKYATQDNVYIYTIKNQTKKSIRSPTRRISSLYWGRQDNNLYFLHHEAKDPSVHSSAFEVKVFRISLATLTPELVTQIPFEEFSVPIENLNLRGIELFLDGAKLSFGRLVREDQAVSENGSVIGVDEEDYLYFVNTKWFRKRLFQIPREISVGDTARYHYRGGDLIVDHIRWIPGGRYVIMEHKYWGVLILEPLTGKIGSLIQAHGRAFGWYQHIGV